MNLDIDFDSISEEMFELMIQSYNMHFKKINDNGEYIEYDSYADIELYDNDISFSKVIIQKDKNNINFKSEVNGEINFNFILEREQGMAGQLGEIAKILSLNENITIGNVYSHSEGMDIQGMEYRDDLNNIDFFYLYIAPMTQFEQMDIEGDVYTSLLGKKGKIKGSEKDIKEDDEGIFFVNEDNPNEIVQILKNNKRYFPRSINLNKSEKYENFVQNASKNPFLDYEQAFFSDDGDYLIMYDNKYDDYINKTKTKDIVKKTKKYKEKKRKNINIIGNPKRRWRRWVKRIRNIKPKQVIRVTVKAVKAAPKVVKDFVVDTAKAAKNKLFSLYESATEPIKETSRKLLVRIEKQNALKKVILPPWAKLAYYRYDSLEDIENDPQAPTSGGIYIFLGYLTDQEIDELGGRKTTEIDRNLIPGEIFETPDTFEKNFFAVSNHNGTKVVEIFDQSLDSDFTAKAAINFVPINIAVVKDALIDIKGAFIKIASSLDSFAKEVFRLSNLVFGWAARKIKTYKPKIKLGNWTKEGWEKGKLAGGLGKIRSWLDSLFNFISNNKFLLMLGAVVGAVLSGLSFASRPETDIKSEAGVPYYEACEYCYCKNDDPENEILCKDYDKDNTDPCITEQSTNPDETCAKYIEFSEETYYKCEQCLKCNLEIEPCTVKRARQGSYWSWLTDGWKRFWKAPLNLKLYWILYLLTSLFILPIGLGAFMSYLGIKSTLGIAVSAFLAEMVIMVPVDILNLASPNMFVKDEGELCRNARQWCKYCPENRFYWVSPYGLQSYGHLAPYEKRYMYNANEIHKVKNYPKLANYSETVSKVLIISSVEKNCTILARDNNKKTYEFSEKFQLADGNYDGNIWKIMFNNSTQDNQLDIVLEVACSSTIKKVDKTDIFGIKVYYKASDSQDYLIYDGEVDSTEENSDPNLNSAKRLYNEFNGLNNQVLIANGRIKEQGENWMVVNRTWWDKYVGSGRKRDAFKREVDEKATKFLMYKFTISTAFTENFEGYVEIFVKEGVIESDNNMKNSSLEDSPYIINFDFGRERNVEESKTSVSKEFSVDVNIPDSSTGENNIVYETISPGPIKAGNYNLFTNSGTGLLMMTKDTTIASEEIVSLPNVNFEFSENESGSIIVIKREGDETAFGVLTYKKEDTIFTSTDEGYTMRSTPYFHEIFPGNDQTNNRIFTQISLTSKGEIILETADNQQTNIYSALSSDITYEDEPIISYMFNDQNIGINTMGKNKKLRNTRSLQDRCNWLYSDKGRITYVAAIARRFSSEEPVQTRDKYVQDVLYRIGEFNEFKRNFIYEDTTKIDDTDLEQITFVNENGLVDVSQRPDFSVEDEYYTSDGVTIGNVLTIGSGFADDNNTTQQDFVKLYNEKINDDLLASDTTISYCDLWVERNGSYIPKEVSGFILDQLDQTVPIYIGPTKDRKSSTVNPGMIVDPYVSVESYSTYGVSIKKTMYTQVPEEQQYRLGLENITDDDLTSEDNLRNLRSALFSVELPNYYYEEVVKGTFDFPKNVVTDYNNGKLYYRDTIGTNEKIILLSDPAFKFIYATNKIVSGGFDENNEEIHIETSMTAPFTKIGEEKTGVFKVLKVRRVKIDGDIVTNYEGGWDTDLYIKGVIYYPTLQSLDETCSGGTENVGSIKKDNATENANGEYIYNLITLNDTNSRTCRITNDSIGSGFTIKYTDSAGETQSFEEKESFRGLDGYNQFAVLKGGSVLYLFLRVQNVMSVTIQFESENDNLYSQDSTGQPEYLYYLYISNYNVNPSTAAVATGSLQ